MKRLLVLMTTMWVTWAVASPLEQVKLKKGMKREEAETLLAKATGKKSTYHIHTMLGQNQAEYSDGEKMLIVTYQPGFPAPYVNTPDGNTEHLAPIDAKVVSWKLEDLILTDGVIRKFIKEHQTTSNEYQTVAVAGTFFRRGRILTEKAIKGLKPYLTSQNDKNWSYHIQLIDNPGITIFGDLTITKRDRKIVRSDFMFEKHQTEPNEENNQ